MVTAQAFGRIGKHQRFTRRNPCPICNGGDDDKRSRGERCWGYYSDDGLYAHCTRPEYAGDLRETGAHTFAHRLDGSCGCGGEHGISEILRAERPAPQPSEPTRHHLRATPTAIYSYGPALRKLRYGTGKGKYFVWQHDAGAGDWLDGQGEHTKGLYLVEGLAAAPPQEPIFLTEGEGKANAIVAQGGVAVSVPDGAKSWRSEYATTFTGRHVVILQDDDTDGQGLTAAASGDLEASAASVRALVLEGAHDVADWIADGHTLLELLKIIACMLPAQNSTRTRQDDMGGTTTPTCLNCARERKLREMAETTMENLRRERTKERQFENRIMAQEPKKLKPTVKLAYFALRREMEEYQHLERDEAGRVRIKRGYLAGKLGVTEQTISGYVKELKVKQLIDHDLDKSDPNDYKMFIGPGPLWDTPWDVAESDKPWGDKRVKACPNCYGTHFDVKIHCLNPICGAVLKPSELISLRLDEEGNPILPDDGLTTDDMPDEPSDTPTHPLPEILETCHLAPDACPASPTGLHEIGTVRLRPSGPRLCIWCDHPEQEAS